MSIDIEKLEAQALNLMCLSKKIKRRRKVLIKKKTSRNDMVVQLYLRLKKKENVYYSTHYVEWIKFRFKETNKVKLKMEKINESLFKLSI